MGGLSIWHIVIVAMIALLLFGGRGKVSDLMGDCAKGINSFRKGLRDGDESETAAIVRTNQTDAAAVAAKETVPAE